MKDKLLATILEYTKSGHLKWALRNSCFNSESKHHYECELNDGSKVQTEISLNTDLNFYEVSFISIINKNFVDGRLFIHKYDNPKVMEIGKLVYQMFVKPTIVPKAKTQHQTIEDIINAIPTKEERRDNKIQQIIGDVEKKFPWAVNNESEKKVNEIDDKKKVENKSKLKRIWNILFGE